MGIIEDLQLDAKRLLDDVEEIRRNLEGKTRGDADLPFLLDKLNYIVYTWSKHVGDRLTALEEKDDEDKD